MTPGEAEQAQEELRASHDALRAAEALLGIDAPRDTASRIYYAVFHAARAALMVRGLYAKTHSGQITLFERTFGPAPILGDLLGLRARADYAIDEFTETSERLREAAVEASTFVERCRTIVDEAVARGSDEPDPPPDY